MIPILVNTSEPMLKVKIVTVKDYSPQTLSLLQKLGVLHVEEASDLSPIDRAAIENELNELRKGLTFINSVLELLAGERTVMIPESVKPQSLSDMKDQARKFHHDVSTFTKKYDRLQRDIDSLEQLHQYLGILAREVNVPIKELQYSGNYLFTRVLVLSEESYKTFGEKTGEYVLQEIAVPIEGEIVTYIIARAEDRTAIDTLIRDLGITALNIPDEDVPLREFIARNDEILQKQRNESDRLHREIQKNIEDNLDQIVILREALREEEVRLSVLHQACEARYVTLIEGYVPEIKADTITSGLKDVLDYAFIETTKPVSTEEPPTKLRNPQGIRPFEVIVKLFSLPKYGGWDPTPSVAYFFAFFFGLMLNDVVYAVGLLLLARFLLDKLVDDPTTEGTQLFRKVLYISGSVALVLGILSGTYLGDFLNMYFGVNLATIALVKGIQERLADPISFIILSLIVGLVHLNIAHMLGLIKGIKENDIGIVLSKIGLFLIQIFGIPYLFQSMLNIELFSLGAATYAAFLYPLLLGLLLVVIGAFIQMGALGAVFWIFDLTGILGDVMSYSRLAGVGLATFYLASSFNLLSNWVSETVSSFIPGFAGLVIAFIIGTILLLIFHVFNLFLSSLAAFIHSLRLCFVEYLLKFYEGGGREYAPFHLRLRKEVTVGKKS
jgi:V/A-type H+-transporting ATPase subunit I